MMLYGTLHVALHTITYRVRLAIIDYSILYSVSWDIIVDLKVESWIMIVFGTMQVNNAVTVLQY